MLTISEETTPKLQIQIYSGHSNAIISTIIIIIARAVTTSDTSKFIF
jgi:hypothetical protein